MNVGHGTVENMKKVLIDLIFGQLFRHRNMEEKFLVLFSSMSKQTFYLSHLGAEQNKISFIDDKKFSGSFLKKTFSRVIDSHIELEPNEKCI